MMPLAAGGDASDRNGPDDDSLASLLTQLNAFGNAFSNDQVMDVWHRLRAEFDSSSPNAPPADTAPTSPLLAPFIFASWAISHVSEIILVFVCDRLYSPEIKKLASGSRSRVKSIADLFHVTSPICWFVLEKQATNDVVLSAFRVIHVQHPELSLEDFCQRAMALLQDPANRRICVTRQTLIRETLKAFRHVV
jgi:hypothetical protein